jgi:uncharacterized protein YfkK (UPF0435 family)
MARKILVFDTTTNTPSTIENFQGNTWGELKAKLPRYDKSMVAMIKENKTNLEHDGAELPVGIGKNSRGEPNGADFTLFLMAGKVKSGNENPDLLEIKAELIAEINEVIDEKFKELTDLFNENLTKMSKISTSEVDALAEEARSLTNN